MPSRQKRSWSNLFEAVVAGCICVFGLASPKCFGQAPPNDNFTNATVLEGNLTTFVCSLTNATYEPEESTDACNGMVLPGGSVWWSWKATNSTAVIIDVLGSTGIETAALNVNTGKLSILTEIDCTGLDSMSNRYVAFSASSGTTYYIRAIGENRSFTFRLTATNAPIVLVPPQSQTVAESASAMFGVIAAGMQPLNYQWLFGGSPVPGQTAATMVLHYLAANQAGAYSVIVTNSGGSITSAVANLVVPPGPPLLLAPVGPPVSNLFSFSIAGQAGRLYRVLASTNFVNWADEESLSPDPGRPALVLNTNDTSVFSIPIVPSQKFLRASHFMNTEICIAQLMAIQHAIRFWAIESRHGLASPVTFQNISPYLIGEPVCPSGGTTFADSYTITDIADPPYCQKVPQTHKLPP